MKSLNRRSFFTRSGLLTAGALSAPAIIHSAPETAARAGAKPRNIIHMVADGMSAGTLTSADSLSHLLRKRGLVWIDLLSNPDARHGLMDMRSLNSLVTDSSAASSSWGSGSRIANGAVNVLPDDRHLTPIYTLFGQKGWKRGLVTTTEVTHATPAGFAANDESRGAAETIALQYFDRKIDLILGGGQKHFDPSRRKDKRDLFADFARAGYTVMKTSSDLAAAPKDKPWLGTFSEGHLPFTVDRNNDPEAQKVVPTLAELTQAALAKLSREPNFILQVEGGRVDHGAHNCDAAGAFYDQIAFDEAVEVCLDFQKRVPDTLIVITTDHGNGNPGLCGMGSGYAKSSELFANLKRIQASFERMTRHLKSDSTPQEIQEVIGEGTGYKVAEAEAALFAETLAKKGNPLFSVMNSTTAQLGQLLGDHTGIGWVSGTHTGDYVQISAVGPGADHFRGFIKNTDVFDHYLAFAGIDFKNPSLPLQASLTPPANFENVAEYAHA